MNTKDFVTVAPKRVFLIYACREDGPCEFPEDVEIVGVVDNSVEANALVASMNEKADEENDGDAPLYYWTPVDVIKAKSVK